MTKILLVEQTSILKKRLEKLLQDMGYSEIVTYTEGLISFEKFYNNKGEFHAVIINIDQFRNDFDVMMNCINAKAKESNVKTVLLSEKTNLNDLANFYSKGVDEIILKPFNDEEIVKKLSINTNSDNLKNIKLVKKKIEGEVRILNWCSDYEIGVEEIDNEHKEIIEHFEKLYELMKAGNGHEYYNELIKFLEYYVDHHFKHEEELQKDVGYRDVEKHKKIHDEFKKQVNNLMSNYDNTNVTNADLVKLNLFIKNWLSEHILIEDKKIGEWITGLINKRI